MSTLVNDQSFSNAYESFIDKHLKTYGYFSKSQTELDDERENWKEYEYDFAALWGKTCSVGKCKSRLSVEDINSEGDIAKQTQLINYKRRSLNYSHQKLTVNDVLNSELTVRWPVEMQVLSQRIQHNEHIPFAPEPLSLSSLDRSALFRPRLEGKVVFSYPVICGKKFTKSYNGSKISYPSDMKKSLPSFPLVFESRFESGNLAKAIQISPTNYELYLRPDLYSEGHAQWFYFKVQNMKRGVNYKFSIVNLHKIAGLFDYGMKPVMYSDRLAETMSCGWQRVGEKVSYSKNEYDPITGERQTSLHTLSWTCQFPFENDTVYFAHSFPYTYSDLQDYLINLTNDPKRSQWCTVDTLCHSLAGNRVYVVTVVSPVEIAQRKRVIVLTARVHPGETPSSWVMKGLIDFLTSGTAIAQTLREKFIFKLVPMLNPDGVIVGNNRYSLSGRDLNRTYKTLLKDVFPPTWHLRRMVRKMLEQYEVALYCDLHGHSRKPNMFVYGCENPCDSPNYLREQIFPLVLGQHAPEMFSFAQCKFHMHKQREGTGRVVMWLMGVTNSYTLEVSFAGSTLGQRRATHFSTSDYRQMAKYLCLSIADYFDDGKAKFFENQLAWRKSMLQQLNDNGSTIETVSAKCANTFRESETSVESILTEDQIDESLQKRKAQSEKKANVSESGQNDVSESQNSSKKKRKKKRLRSAKSNPGNFLGVVQAKPVNVACNTCVQSSTMRNIVPVPKKRVSDETTATATWQRYQKLFEPRNHERCTSTFNLIRVSSPRRIRLRSLLNLQRNIIAQALILRESSPLHKKLTKSILKETLATTESLSKELQLINDADKKAMRMELAEKTKAKVVKKQAVVRPFIPRTKPKATIPFQLSIKTTTRVGYKGIMVP